MDVSAKLPALPEQPSPPGAVVVQNGRHSGTRRALKRPLTLLGQALGCDIRLQEDGIAPFHCAIVHDQSGPLLRDLSGAVGTRINGQIVHSHRLANGGVVEVGSLRLLVELDTPPTSEAVSADAVLLERERDALRIQVAAVAAQQAALVEEESRLDQRATALTRQEAQLARHLEERQGKLDEEQDRLKREREAFEEESSETRDSLEARSKEVSQAQNVVERQRQEGEAQRRRLNELRRKLWKRYQTYWQGRDSAMSRREANLQGRETRLQDRKKVVEAFFARVNGERELGRRQLREEAQELALAQQRWQEGLEQDRQEQKRRQAELDQRASELDSASEALEVDQGRWRQEQQRLERECRGLEARVRHLHEQMQREPAPTGSPMVPFTPLPMAPALLVETLSPHWPGGTRELAGMLSDQRAHLAEQWRLLLEVHKTWQEERISALGQLEVTAGQLLLRERELTGSEGRIRQMTADLEQRQQRLTEARAGLEARQARLVVEQSDWQAQRDEALADLEERERGLGELHLQFDDDRRRHDGRASEELALLREARARCDEARRQYSQLWQDCEELRAALAEQERHLAADSLALEQQREELVHSSADSVRAEGRLEKLARRETARLDAESKAVGVERERLEGERARLDEDGKLLGQQEAAFVARQRDWSRQAADWNQRRATDEEEVRRTQEVGRLRARHVAQERQLRQLRDELERLARILIDEAPEPTAQRAA